jgi:hypothetical protein
MKVEDIPEFFPAFFGLHVDPCGRWWVRRTPQEAGGTTVFDVFSHEGHFLATTSVPVGLLQWGVGSRLLAGIAVDAAGTPGLVRFTLKWADGDVGDGEAGRCH